MEQVAFQVSYQQPNTGNKQEINESNGYIK